MVALTDGDPAGPRQERTREETFRLAGPLWGALCRPGSLRSNQHAFRMRQYLLQPLVSGGHRLHDRRHRASSSSETPRARSSTPGAEERRPGSALRVVRLALARAPKEISRNHRSHDRTAITKQADELVQVLDLQAVVEGVAEAVGAVKQSRRAQEEEHRPRQRMAQHDEQMLVAGGREQAPREREPE